MQCSNDLGTIVWKFEGCVMAKILLLEDDSVLAETIQDLLSSEGHDVTLARDGTEAIDLSYEGSFDIYLFDVNVPEVNGFDLLKSLRDADDATPAIFITALADIASISKGFKAGADDYIKKPFDPDELLVRIEAKAGKRAVRLVNGPVSYDVSKRSVYLEDAIVDLGEVQREILHLLMEHAGQNVDKSLFYDVMEIPSDSALRVHITKLKKLLPLEITNVRGVGYRLEKA